MGNRLTDEQRQTLVEQFADAFASSQESYDVSIRTLASAGVAVTVSLGVALEVFGRPGVGAVGCFLASLLLNLMSYWTAMGDTYRRLMEARGAPEPDVEWNGLTWVTHALNAVAGVALLTGGAMLAWFVASST